MRIDDGETVVVADYPGHPCQIQLSRALADRNIRVCHVYCPDIPTGRGNLDPQPDDHNLEILPIPLGSQVERYRPLRRIRQELHWGFLLGREMRRRKPSIVVFSNLPLLCQLLLVLARVGTKIRLVLWQQDVHSVAIAAVAKRKWSLAGRVVGCVAHGLEGIPARASAAILTISPAFRDTLEAWGVDLARVVDFANWAPIDELPVMPRMNEWRSRVGLAGRPVVLYAGTLGLKHDPELLVRVAEALTVIDPEAALVVVSEGIGREHLDAVRASRPELPLITLDYQPYDQLPSVLGAADVLLAVLEEDAGRYSVPSKVLSYLCAGRPVLGLMPSVNAAAETIEAASAGVVVEPHAASAEAVEAALRTLLDPAAAAAYGESARRYAEREFDVAGKADLFLDTVLARAPGYLVARGSSARGSAAS